MKKLKMFFILLWVSIFLMIIISAATPLHPQDTTKAQKVILINQRTILRNQDTMMKNQDSMKNNSYKQEPQRKMTDEEKKEREYMEWQQRSKQIDKSIDKLDEQSMMMDSIILKSKKK